MGEVGLKQDGRGKTPQVSARFPGIKWGQCPDVYSCR